MRVTTFSTYIHCITCRTLSYFWFRQWAWRTNVISKTPLKTVPYHLVWTYNGKKMIAWHSPIFGISFVARKILLVLKPWKLITWSLQTDYRKIVKLFFNRPLQRSVWNITTRDIVGMQVYRSLYFTFAQGERGGSVVECPTPEREVGGSIPTAAVLCPWARHFTPRKYWLITQEALAPSQHDWKIVDWDVKPQHKQTNKYICPSYGTWLTWLKWVK